MKKFISFSLVAIISIVSLSTIFQLAAAKDQELSGGKVTIIYDAFGKPSDLDRGWGYSALVEYGGKRILFDTGGQYEAFKANINKLKIDLTKLDFVVLSHRHGDHTSGLAYVLEKNPNVVIYAPSETGSFGTPFSAPQALQRKVDSLPDDLQYFDGKIGNGEVDSPWKSANIKRITDISEVAPNISLIRTVSDVKGTLELAEVSMAIKTPKGLAVIVGCSHPGIEKILAKASEINPNIYTIAGGLHLVDKSDEVVRQTVTNFKEKWKLQRVAAGHCTGHFAQVEITKVFSDKHDHSGLGDVIALP
ncbi:MBL fold metallo-hydrolase [Polynucleobacter rarus]|uniref:MBL fold metallo-hydrolase n=1 Tax=Polynucleobacter rarus TaxID=556055 RepID=UPI000D3EC821|nr:MBL fold metallo-hydrolase [Polynucleobacter rarus]